MNKTALSIIFVNLTAVSVGSAVQAAGNCASVEANSNVVEISIDGIKRAASGVLLTYDGYIITAAHPLLEGLEPPHPIGVFVRTRSSGWQNARVKRIDATLDTALLKLGKAPTSFLPVRAVDERISDDASVCLRRGHIKDAGATAKHRCRLFLTQCR
jgi:hypothetical protein